MKLGKFTIDVADSGIFGLDGGSMFGVVPKVLWSKAYHPGDEMNRIPLAARPMLVRWEGHNLLIDSGNGDKISDKLAHIYNIDKSKSNIENVLKPFGLKPDDITDLILTHLHFDHAGGSTRILDGKVVPAFPNAKYYIQKSQLEWAQNPTEKDRASYMKDDFMPLLADGMFQILDGEGEIFPGISVLLSFGHTQGMQMVKIHDEGKTVLYCADFCPTSAHLPVPYVMGFDNFPLKMIEEKKKILPIAYEENWIVCFEHDHKVQGANVISTEKGFSAGSPIVITDFIQP